jgi:aromatic-L-amino-acid decarboxylase
MAEDERTTPLEETLDPADWESAGIAVVSGTSLGGNYVLHLAHCNHRTRMQDFDALVQEVIRIGRELVGPATLGSRP